MSWLDSPLLALDTESTGTDPTEARIVQITVGMSVGPGDWHPWTRIVNPGVFVAACGLLILLVPLHHLAGAVR